MLLNYQLKCLQIFSQYTVGCKKKGALFTLAISGIFPPLKACANEFSLPFSYTKTLARP
jgi:hypothetical protein